MDGCHVAAYPQEEDDEEEGEEGEEGEESNGDGSHHSDSEAEEEKTKAAKKKKKKATITETDKVHTLLSNTHSHFMSLPLNRSAGPITAPGSSRRAWLVPGLRRPHDQQLVTT